MNYTYNTAILTPEENGGWILNVSKREPTYNDIFLKDITVMVSENFIHIDGFIHEWMEVFNYGITTLYTGHEEYSIPDGQIVKTSILGYMLSEKKWWIRNGTYYKKYLKEFHMKINKYGNAFTIIG